MKSFSIREFNNIDELDCEEIMDNTICLVHDKNIERMDITANYKSLLPLLKRLQYSLRDRAIYRGWFEGFIEDYKQHGFDGMDASYDGRVDIENGVYAYSWGIEPGDGYWYIFLNIKK